MIMTGKKGISEERHPAEEKIKAWCAYQDRCETEVRRRLARWGVTGPSAKTIISRLKKDSFLDEQRFAVSYARGKFSSRKWGRIRIEHELKSRNISDDHISQALAQIDESEYLAALKSLILGKLKSLSESDRWIVYNKVITFAVSRGYEAALAESILGGCFGDTQINT